MTRAFSIVYDTLYDAYWSAEQPVNIQKLCNDISEQEGFSPEYILRVFEIMQKEQNLP